MDTALVLKQITPAHDSPALPTEQWDDGSLIAACLDGNRQAWALLVTRYERLIFSIPLRMGLGEGEASDIFQEVCLTMLEKLGGLRDEQRLPGWIATTTRRACWAALRRRDAAGADEPDDFFGTLPSPEDDPALLVERWEAWQALRVALAGIGERCQQLLTLLYYESPSPSYSEISDKLGIAEGSIGPTRARCLKKLHHQMGGRFYRADP